MKALAVVVLVIFVVVGSCALQDTRDAKVDEAVTILIERVYMQAQIDAIEGRLRVIPIENDYRWVSSPWSADVPAFQSYSSYIGWQH